MTITQHITATVLLTADEHVTVDTHGGRGEPGSHIMLTFGSVSLLLQDRGALDCYAAAWLDGVPAETARHLPADSTVQPTYNGPHYPVMAIKATGADVTLGVFDAARRALVVRIGYVTWLVHDQGAYYAHAELWRHLRKLAPLILPRTS